MENPLTAIRKKKGFSVTDFGVIAGVSTVTVNRLERGVPSRITPEVLEVVEKWGYDREQVASDYEKWKAYRVKQLQQKALA